MIKVELRRAILSKSFAFTCILNLLMLAIGGCDYILDLMKGRISTGTYLEKFLVAYGYGMTSLLAVFFPIVAMIPYVLSYRKERDSGYLKLMVLKESRKEYNRAKLLSVACSGFLSLFLTCFLWLLVSYFVLRTNTNGQLLYFDEFFAEKLYETQPFIYGMMYVCNAGVQGAVFAVLGLGLSAVLDNRYLAIILPFGYCIFTAAVVDMYNTAFNALSLFVPAQYFNDAIGHWGMVIYDVILVSVGIGLFLRGQQNEYKE